jgi:hypothetical protein
MSLAFQLAIPPAAFAAGTAIALVAGAAGLGVAAAFGQIAFAIAVVAVLLRDRQRLGEGG